MNIFGLGGLYGVHGGFGYNSLGTGSLGAGYLGTGYLGTGYLSTGYLGTGSLGTGSFGYNSVNNAALKHVNGINSGFAQAASPSFQHVLAASIKGEGLAALLSAQYPDIKYQVMDTSKIDAALWQRNDYPFERFYAEKADTSVLDWKPSAQEPSMTDARVQARLNAARGKYAVIVPPELEEKLDGNTELAQDIFCKITALAMQQDTVPRTIDSFSIALDKDGNIANYRFSGGGGQLMFPYGTLLERNAAQKTGTAKTLHQKRRHHLNE